MREAAALGDTWHFGIATLTAAHRTVVGDVLGLRSGHTGKVAGPGGVAYVVAARPAPTIVDALTELRNRYDPAVLVLVETTDADEVIIGAPEPVETAAAQGRGEQGAHSHDATPPAAWPRDTPRAPLMPPILTTAPLRGKASARRDGIRWPTRHT